MKRLKIVLNCLLLVCMGSCQSKPVIDSTQQYPASITVSKVLTETATATQSTNSPTNTVTVSPLFEPYSDVRNLDLRDLEFTINEATIMTYWFNETTKFSEDYQQIADQIVEKGKNPGLGIRSLHEKGITGKGVTVAIIDQNMVTDHPEFAGKIIEYKDFGTEQSPGDGSMHGPAVTSLLVGKNTGTAPDARVYYASVPSWKADAQYYADALDWIVKENQKLSDGEKIRVVSVSAAPSGQGTPFTVNNEAWDEAVQRASEAGLLVLDCTENHGMTAPCYYDMDDPDTVSKCVPGWPNTQMVTDSNRIYVPTSRRTTAEEYKRGKYSYQFTGYGGLSWSIPYLSGVLALGWQLRPDLGGEEMVNMIFDSANIQEDDVKIIDPIAFIELVKQAK